MWKNVFILVLGAGCLHFVLLAMKGNIHSQPESDDSIVVFSAPMGSEPIEPMRSFNADGTRNLKNDGGW